MKIEHVALNVSDPPAMANWYVEHMGMTVKRQVNEAPWAYFLADGSGSMMLEIYANPAAPVPDYRQQSALVMHIAWISTDIDADVRRLTSHGAQLDGEYLHAENGDVLAMLRDPWGIPIQLATRSTPMI